MAFTHGKSARVYMDALNMSNYLRSIEVSAEADTAESSVFGADYKQYVNGLTDATLSGEGILEATQDGVANATLGAASRSIWQAYFAGDSIGLRGRGLDADTTSYSPSSDLGDVVQFTIEAQSSVGADPIVSHHAHGQETTSGTAASVDNTDPTTGGGVAYLNVTAITGSAVITLQDSADDSTFVDVATFGTVTTPGGYRETVTGTVDRYTRLVHTNAAGTITFVAGLGRAN